ncbi:MAG: L-threonylcarbamoyladenylate synthase [Parerythrobacter sp.]
MDGKNATERLADDAGGIARAVSILKQGGLVAVPTETVYGLAARADDAAAVARIYDAKGRPAINPLIVHVADIAGARALVQFPEAAETLARDMWPGPVTLVLPMRENAGFAPQVSAGLPTLAVRVPAHPVMQALLAACGFPLAAPSANRSETVSPTTAAHVLATLDGRIDAVLDGGPTARGLESTILALREDATGTHWEELRPGPVSLGFPAQASTSASIEAPGQMRRHYAPGKPLRLDATLAREGEYLIGFAAVAGDVSLSRTGDLAEAAQRLFACLHLASASPQPRIAVAPVPHEGVGRAINDRLGRAAA